MPQPRFNGLLSGDCAVGLRRWGSEPLGSSVEAPVPAGGPGVTAVGVAGHAEDGVLGAVVMAAQALAVLGAGGADRPGDAVVEVDRAAVAAGEHAGPVAGL